MLSDTGCCHLSSGSRITKVRVPFSKAGGTEAIQRKEKAKRGGETIVYLFLQGTPRGSFCNSSRTCCTPELLCRDRCGGACMWDPGRKAKNLYAFEKEKPLVKSDLKKKRFKLNRKYHLKSPATFDS